MPGRKRKVAKENIDKAEEKKAKKEVEEVEEEVQQPKVEMKDSLKILCWNVNGIRAWFKKETPIKFVKEAAADIICLQEVKCSKSDIPADFLKQFPLYDLQWLTGEKAGYAGVAILSKVKPIKVEFGLGKTDHDAEGRVITAEFDKFYLINAYVPNSGRGLPRLPYRTSNWEPDMREYLKKLDAKKPVIMCGDLNVAHKEIDLANPKTNQKTAGFTPQERAEFDKLLKLGFTDTFRHLNPDKTGAYTFWSNRGGAREKNVGWRLDYFLVSDRFQPKVVDSTIAGRLVTGSDHCPLMLYANP